MQLTEATGILCVPKFKVSLMAHDSRPGFISNRQIDVSLRQETFVLYSGVIMKSTEHYVASQCLLLLLFLLLLKGCSLS